MPALLASPRITAPLLYFRSTEDHVVDEATEPLITAGVSSTDVTVVRLADSYHVATLDNDAEQIYADSAAFVARVGFIPAVTRRSERPGVTQNSWNTCINLYHKERKTGSLSLEHFVIENIYSDKMLWRCEA